MADSFDILVIGAGPAGLAAACCAAESGRRVGIVDDNPDLGGQIWRNEVAKPSSKEAARWLKRVRLARCEFLPGAQVISQPRPECLLVDEKGHALELLYRKLIIATGARELFLPFPGWTLPNVLGAGGLQALVKGGLPIKEKRVVVAGSGPLLLAVAAYLGKCGADVLLIAEQASWTRLLRFGLSLLRQPKRASQAFELKTELRGIPYLKGCWVLAAEGRDKLKSVWMRQGRKEWTVPCDYLASGFHLIPNLELPILLGCEIER